MIDQDSAESARLPGRRDRARRSSGNGRQRRHGSTTTAQDFCGRLPRRHSMSASHTGSPWTRPISTDRLRRPTLSRFQPRTRWFSSSTFPLQSHAKSRHFPSSELYEQREFAGLVAEWSALTHSNSLIGRLPPATIGTWLNTAGAPGRGMSGPPIESLTRSKMTSLAWPIGGSRPRIAAIPSWVSV